MDIRTAEVIIRGEMFAHGLTSNGWKFKWDRALRRNGLCNYTHKTISLSKPLAEIKSEAEVRNTILHEIAHALVGPGHGHNYIWRRKHLSLGGNGQRCGVSPPEVKEMARYIVQCSVTGQEMGRIHRLTKNYRNRIGQPVWGCKCHRKPFEVIDTRA